MSNDEPVSPAIEWVNNLERDQLLAECEKRHILPDSPSARTTRTLRKKLRDFVCEHGATYLPPPSDPSVDPEVEALGLRTFMVVAVRFARNQITSDQAISEISRLAGIATSTVAQAVLVLILTKLREKQLSNSEAEAEIEQLAIEHPAVPPEQPFVLPVVTVKIRTDFDPDPAVAERQIIDAINTGAITGENGQNLLREVRAEITQPPADHPVETPPPGEELEMPEPDPAVPVVEPPVKKRRKDYPRDLQLAEREIRRDARKGVITNKNADDLLDRIREEKNVHVHDNPNDDTPRRTWRDRMRLGGGGRGPRDPGNRRYAPAPPPDDRVVLTRRDDRLVDRRATDDSSDVVGTVVAAALIILAALLILAALIKWGDDVWDWLTDDNDTPAGPVVTQPTPTPGGNPGGQATVVATQAPAATATPGGNPGGSPGGQPGASTVNGQAPAWTAPAVSGDPNSWAKTIIETAPQGAWFHRVFKPRDFHAPDWGGADSWAVSLALGPNSGGAWTSFGNPGQIIYRGTTNHLAWCLGVATDSEYKAQFMDGSSAASIGINVRITPNSLVTTSGPQGVKSGTTSDAGDILIELPDDGVVTICVDYTTAAPTHESHVWWGPHDRPNEPINVISQR